VRHPSNVPVQKTKFVNRIRVAMKSIFGAPHHPSHSQDSTPPLAVTPPLSSENTPRSTQPPAISLHSNTPASNSSGQTPSPNFTSSNSQISDDTHSEMDESKKLSLPSATSPEERFVINFAIFDHGDSLLLKSRPQDRISHILSKESGVTILSYSDGMAIVNQAAATPCFYRYCLVNILRYFF
jgi:hypothetical protein